MTISDEQISKASDTALKGLEALRQAVREELDRKRRLGHYYVIGGPDGLQYIGPDAPKTDQDASHTQ